MKSNTSIAKGILGIGVIALCVLGGAQAFAQASTETAAPAPVGAEAALAETAAALATSTRTAPTRTAPDLPPPVPQSRANGLRFKFRGASLDSVLDYMSVAAGFIIVRDADVRGTVDVISHQPVDKEEAVLLLNTILNQKGLAAIRNDRTLTIVERDEARTRDLPIIMGGDPELIPKTDVMVTQIIPVRYTDVSQLMQNLDPLLPEYATISANQSSRAIIITDTQTNIRRAAEIIRALDTSSPQSTTVRIIRIKNAEANEVANIINQIFGSTGSGSSGSGRSREDEERRRRFMEMMSRMRGGGGPPGGFRGRGR